MKRKTEDESVNNKKIKIEESDSSYKVDSESEPESEPESDFEFDEKKLNRIIKDSIQHVIKNYGKQTDNSDVYGEFNGLVQDIYNGQFFERIPIEKSKDLKDKISIDEMKVMKNELSLIQEKYMNSSPSVIDILKMNISIEQKQKLLEKVHCLVNSDILTREYNLNMKYLNSNISNNEDPELLILEESILKSTLNKMDSYRLKILKSEMSFNNKVIAYKKLEIMETYEDTDTSEYAKYKAWMDLLLSIPFGVYNKINININSDLNEIKSYIKRVRNILDEKLSFLEKPKDQMINLVSHMIRNPGANINAIGLCGPAGVGKTSIGESIAKALNRPFKMISLGGESDASNITGHNFTYIGSGPGIIINSLIDTKSMECVVLLDELDKIGDSNNGKDIIATLIHITDSTTNNKYNLDKYFSGIEFDLSKVLFIFTYNDASKIDKILSDRLLKININNYNKKEKLEITNKHIIPYILNKFNFTESDITFEEKSIEYIINNSMNSGMRDIKTKLKIIISRINNLLLTQDEDNIIRLNYKKLYSYYNTLPVVILKEHVDILLDESIINETNSTPFGMYI